MPVEFALRKRIAQLWGVSPYRIDVSVPGFHVRLDGQAPSDEQMQILERDIEAVTKAFKSTLN